LLGPDEQSQLVHISLFSGMMSSNFFPVIMNGGAVSSRSNNRSFLHGYKKLPTYKVLYDSAKRAHHSVGEGYTELACGPTEDGVGAHVLIHCFQMPSLTVTVLFVLQHSTKYEAHTIYANHKTQRGYVRIHGLGIIKYIYIPGILHEALL
jgi:hypothetical protein